jgi:hypothetical protein
MLQLEELLAYARKPAVSSFWEGSNTQSTTTPKTKQAIANIFGAGRTPRGASTHETSNDGAGWQGLALQTAQRAISTPHVRADATGKAPAGKVAQDGFAIDEAGAYVGRMVRNKLELPAAVARRFAADMRGYQAEPNAIKREEIAAHQLHALKQHYAGKLRLSDVKEIFAQLKDQIGEE